MNIRKESEILAEIRSLCVDTSGPSVEPVQSSGWYKNKDDTLTRYGWSDGRPVAGPTVRDGDAGRYDELQQELIFAMGRV